MSTDIPNIEADGVVDAPGHHDSGSFGEEHVHQGLTDRQYIAVALILAVITALEVSLTYIDIGALFLPVLLILMVIKFFTVVLYFMHLKFDNRLFTVLFYMGLGLAVFVYTVALFTFHFFGS
jgi:cytochrome c oxidase subunit 4